MKTTEISTIPKLTLKDYENQLKFNNAEMNIKKQLKFKQFRNSDLEQL